MKNRTNLFLAPYTVASGTSFISKKKRTKILKKISPKNIPSGSGIRKKSSWIRISDSGGKKAQNPGSGSATLKYMQ
jgi:hypothetical protein